MKRLLTLNILLAIGLGSIFLLPASSTIQESAIIMDLPPLVGDWTAGPKEEASDKVKDILKAKAYENRTYRHDLTGQIIRASIVLSSDNINQSIHRPERCLPAQGHQILSSESVEIPIEFEGTKKPHPVTKLITEMRFQKPEDEEPRILRSSTYYWFVGRTEQTNSHLKRTQIDMVDRLLHGYTQRWAYISLETTTEVEDGFVPQEGAVDLIQELIPEIIQPTLLR